MCPVTYCLAVAQRSCLCGPAHGSCPCGPASNRPLRPIGTDVRIYHLRPSGPGAGMLLPWAGGGPGAIHFITRSNLDVILQNPRHAIPSQHHATPCDTLPNSLSPMAQPDKFSQPSPKPTHTIPHPLNTPCHAMPHPQHTMPHSPNTMADTLSTMVHHGTLWHS